MDYEYTIGSCPAQATGWQVWLKACSSDSGRMLNGLANGLAVNSSSIQLVCQELPMLWWQKDFFLLSLGFGGQGPGCDEVDRQARPVPQLGLSANAPPLCP